MYETIKELHIEIEQRIQQITSNRYGSMPPQFYDMMLNRTAIKYIQSKSNRKTNYKGEGLEDSMKRVEDFQSLKRETDWLPVIKDDDDSERGFVLLPSNYLKFITSTSKLQFEKNISKTIKTETDDDFKNTYYIVSGSLSKQDIAESKRSVTDLVDMVITDDEESDIYAEIDLLFQTFSTSVDLPKYVIEYIHDLFNVKLESACEINFKNEFDGIWACASLLHCLDLNLAFNNCYKALTKDGIMYASFKYGDFKGERNGRFFVDLTLDKVKEVANSVPKSSMIKRSQVRICSEEESCVLSSSETVFPKISNNSCDVK